MTFDPDHDEFLLNGFLGKNAIYTQEGAVAKSIRVLFTLGVEDLELEGSLSPQTVLGVAGCKASDVTGIKSGEPLEIEGTVYRVLNVQTDETGWTTLHLGESYG